MNQRKKLLVALSVLAMPAFPAASAWGALAANLDNVIVFPNPYKPVLGHTAVVFDNLTAAARIRVYKITGENVFDLTITTVDGTYTWPVVNKDGEGLATGVYIYMVSDDAGQKKTGKIAVVK